jgi:FKBP-type peptidyl-prolyl cis-trans isomerase
VNRPSAAALAALLLAALPLAACQPKPQGPAPVTPATQEEKTIYALGVLGADRFKPLHLTPAELELVVAGLRDGAAGKALVTVEEKQADLDEFVQARQRGNRPERHQPQPPDPAKAKAFLEQAEKAPGAQKAASGLVYVPIKEGPGPSPTAADDVKVSYTGKLVDGTVFDSTEGQGPAVFAVSQVVRCWTEGLQKMKLGGKARLVCPPGIAYGDAGSGPIPPGAVLDFEVELLDIISAKPPAGGAAHPVGGQPPAGHPVDAQPKK